MRREVEQKGRSEKQTTGAFSDSQFQKRIHMEVEDLETDSLKIIHGLLSVESLWVHQEYGTLD